MATLAKRNGSTRPWQVRYRDHTGAQRSEQFTAKADAEAFRVKVERAAQTGRLDLLQGEKQTLAEIGLLFFKAHKGDWALATAKAKVSAWNAHIDDHDIASMPVGRIRKSHVLAFKADLIEAGVGPGAVRKALEVVSQVLDFAADDDLIAANPARGVKRPSALRAGDVPVIAPEGVEAIRAALGTLRRDADGPSAEIDALAVSIMAYAGLRPQEVRALRWRHVGHSLRVEFAADEDGNLKRLKGTSGKARSVPICAALRADLDAARPSDAADDDLIIGGKKADWDNFRARRFAAAVEAAGVRLDRPYDLRHSIASLWMREGIDSAEIARRMGHSIAVLHGTYSHVLADLDPDDRRSADDLIAAARKRSR